MKPTYKEVVAALGSLLAEYAELDEMLDSFMENSEPTLAERRRQRDNNQARDKVQKVYLRVLEAQRQQS